MTNCCRLCRFIFATTSFKGVPLNSRRGIRQESFSSTNNALAIVSDEINRPDDSDPQQLGGGSDVPNIMKLKLFIGNRQKKR